MKIYLAAASKEIERAELVAAWLIDHGHTVTSTWMAQIRQVGAANPRDATDDRRETWARRCLREIAESDVLWFLVPPAHIDTAGAWAELATAFHLPHVQMVASGDTRRSIFCALANEFPTDGAALLYVLGLQPW